MDHSLGGKLDIPDDRRQTANKTTQVRFIAEHLGCERETINLSPNPFPGGVRMLTAAYSMFNRRHFLKHMAGLSLMALPAFRFLQGINAFAQTLKKNNKSLIILWMSGGPPTIDLWDLKSGQPTGGEFKPIGTTASGIQISEHL